MGTFLAFPAWAGELADWLKLLGLIVSSLLLVWQPVRRVLNASKKTMDDMREALDEQKRINDSQVKCIEESVHDRERLHTEIKQISVMSQTQAQIEINKITHRVLDRGKITAMEKAALAPLWAAYKENRWNHIRGGDVNAALEMPLETEK